MFFCVAKISQGGGVAAPVAGKIFSEVLPYLEIPKEGEEKVKETKVPNLIGKTIKEAETLLKERNLIIKLDENEKDKEKTITKQIPEKDVKIKEGSYIIVHTN